MSITQEFLKHFPGQHLFVTKTDGQGLDPNLPKPKPIHINEPFERAEGQLREREEFKWGTFFVVNELDTSLDKDKHRSNKMVVKCRAIWVEDDVKRDGPRDDFPIKPNIVVSSSPGKYHYYWLTKTRRFDEWKGVMQTMVNEWGCDNSAKDLSRILRLPGFTHNKGDAHDVTFEVLKKTPYSWPEILKNFPPSEVTKDSKSDSSKPTDHIEAIITGDNFHQSFHSIAAATANRTLHKDTILQLLRGLGYQALANPEFPEERRERLLRMLSTESVELEEIVDWVINETAKEREDIDDDEEEIKLPENTEANIQKYELEYPPGLMGQLCREVYEMAPHPNKEVAIMGAFALVAGIVGRKFNVLDMGLNLYIALLADSGIGKANIKNMINKVLISDADNMKGGSYKGSSRFTGPKAIFDMLSNGLSRVCILEESGLMHQSTAGDQSGINRVLLDIYTSSGKNEYAGGEAYSDNKASIPLLRAPALTIAHISTPKSFLQALKSKNSELSGEMARLWTLRSMNDKEYLNRKKRKQFSDVISERLRVLMKLCADRQLDDKKPGKVLEIKVPDEIFKHSDEYVDQENKFKQEGDTVRRTILSRAFAKSLKIASVISVFNGTDKLDNEAYTWAREEAINKEIAYIQDSITHEAGDDLDLTARNIVGTAIVKCLKREYGKDSKNSPKKLAAKGIFSRTNISQILCNNSVLRMMDDDPERSYKPRKGLDKMIDYMLERGLIVKVSESDLIVLGSRVRQAYKITYEFEVLFND